MKSNQKSSFEKDYGTQELNFKKLLLITEEPLDLCLAKKIITEDEHRAGIHLRWLYSIKFGIQSLTTRPKFIIQESPIVRDESWLIRKNFEYKQAIMTLTNSGTCSAVMDLCVFSRPPGFLMNSQRTLRYNKKKFEEYCRIKTGLKTLVKLWRSKASSKNSKKSVK